jgi:Tol biopolymer transport system component
MPDGRRMVFAGSIAPMNKAVLWLADTRDETLTRLTDGSVELREPAVSPDGRRVAFTRVDQDADIIELPLDGGAPRNLLATSSFEYSPAWSPKGGAFAYMTWRNGTEELWMPSSQGDWERPVATPKEFPGLIGLINPAVSPDGSRVVYWTVLRDADHPSPSVYVSPTAGGRPTWIAPGGAASWSPDGASLAFWWMKPTGESVVATLRLGSNEQPFEIPGSNCHTVPEWSPSGEWIGCGSGKDATLISPDGKVKRALPGLYVGWVGWSKDSRTLYGLHGESGSWSLLAADIRTGAIRTVADYSSQILPFSSYTQGLRLSLSPDGKSFAVGTLKSKWDLWTLEGFTK